LRQREDRAMLTLLELPSARDTYEGTGSFKNSNTGA